MRSPSSKAKKQAPLALEFPPPPDDSPAQLIPIGAAAPEVLANREIFLTELIARGTLVHAPNPVRYSDAMIAIVLVQWGMLTTPAASTDLVEVADPINEKEDPSKEFAAFMAEAQALKEHDDAAMQDLIFRLARHVARSKSALAGINADKVLKAIAKATRHSIEGLRTVFKIRFTVEFKEAEAEAAAAGPGSSSWGPAGASSSAKYYGAYGQYCLDEYGLFWRNRKKKWEKISQPFEILGYARDTNSEEWGKVIKFTNKDGLVRREIVGAELLYNDAKTVTGRLGYLGMIISGDLSEQRALIEFLLLDDQTDKRVMVAHRVGWIMIGGKRAFILPGENISDEAIGEEVVLSKGIRAPHARRGTLDEWRNNIAVPAADHLMTQFAISTALSGPLLDLGGFESGLVHLFGPSSLGKTTFAQDSGVCMGLGRRWWLHAHVARNRQRPGRQSGSHQRHFAIARRDPSSRSTRRRRRGLYDHRLCRKTEDGPRRRRQALSPVESYRPIVRGDAHRHQARRVSEARPRWSIGAGH